jgi:HAD superfamily phosphoserine phosphatase-like hydrolase
MSKIKFIFDLDGTITSEETLPLMAKHFNVQEEIEQLTRETIQGDIPFVESFIRRVFILGKLPVDEVAALLENVKMYPELVDFIREHKEQCVVATGNLMCWSEKLLAKLGCEYYCSEALVDANKVVKITKILDKEQIVAKYKNEGYEVVFIGNKSEDLEAMRSADIAIATGMLQYPAKSILPMTNYLIFSEEALCRQLSQLL